MGEARCALVVCALGYAAAGAEAVRLRELTTRSVTRGCTNLFYDFTKIDANS